MNNIQQKVIFRCDASAIIGGGHVMRCLTLADELARNGWQCVFSCNEEASSIIPDLNKYKSISPENLEQQHVDLLVVDHYGLDHEFERKARAWANKILVIDDLANRPHDCDILLDQTYGRMASDYKALTPPSCSILTGAKYALLRPQFNKARAKSLALRTQENIKLKRVLISLGMMNMFNITSKTLQGIELFTDVNLQIDVVLADKANNIDEIKEQISHINTTGFHSVTLYTNVKDMAKMMSAADLAIGAGGTTSWERCCLGLPTIVIELADNQSKIIEELAIAGAIINMGWHEHIEAQSVASSLDNLYNTPETMMEMSKDAANICDGRGSFKIIEEIANVYT